MVRRLFWRWTKLLLISISMILLLQVYLRAGFRKKIKDDIRASPTLAGRRFVSVDNNSKEPVNVLILAYFRSGSTFLGQILSKLNNSFYVFEPLYSIQKLVESQKHTSYLNGSTGPPVVSGYEIPLVIRTLRSYFQCEFKNIPLQMLSSGFSSSTPHLKTFNRCRKPSNQVDTNERCLQGLHSSCQGSSGRIAKTIRLSMITVGEILKHVPSLKVLHLVRDPRGQYLSSMQHGLRQSEQLQWRICNKVWNDIRYRKYLEKVYPSTFFEVIFEDLAHHPVAMTKAIYKFIGVDLPVYVQDWVRLTSFVSACPAQIPPGPLDHRSNLSQETPQKDTLCSSSRRDRAVMGTAKTNSTIVAYSWVKRINWKDVVFFQRNCRDLLNHGNFSLITSEKDLKTFSIPIRRCKHC